MKTVLVVFFVNAAEATHPATVAAVRATREVLGPDHRVEIEALDNLATDNRLIAAGEALQASTVVELLWEGTSHRQVKLRLHLDPRAKWNERVLGFQDSDNLEERGRTIGYVVASMIPPVDANHEQATPPENTLATFDPRAAPGGSGAPNARPPAASLFQGRAETAEASARFPAGANAAHHPGHGAFDIVGSGAVGVGGVANGIGGAATASLDVLGPFSLLLGMSARTGQVTQAQATSLTMHAAAGLGWNLSPATLPRRWSFGVRLDGLLMREQLSHFDADDNEPDVQARWLPGVDAAVDVAWFFSSSSAFLASLGPEIAFGETDVKVHQQTVASLPPLRLVLQAGVRTGF